MMKTLLFLLGVWCLLGLGLLAPEPARPTTSRGKPPVPTVAAGVIKLRPAVLSLSTLDVF